MWKLCHWLRPLNQVCNRRPMPFQWRLRLFAENRAMALRQAVHDSKIAGTAMVATEVDAISEAAAGADGTIAAAGVEATVDLGANFHPRNTLHHELSKIVPQTPLQPKGICRLFCRASL